MSTPNQDPTTQPPPQIKRAKIFIAIECPECGDELESCVEIVNGKSAAREIICEWDEIKLKVPELWVKG